MKPQKVTGTVTCIVLELICSAFQRFYHENRKLLYPTCDAPGAATGLNFPGEWMLEKHDGYSIQFTDSDKSSAKEYAVNIDKGIGDNEQFFGKLLKSFPGHHSSRKEFIR